MELKARLMTLRALFSCGLVSWIGRAQREGGPGHLAPPQFFGRILRALFERAPITDYEEARKLWLTQPRSS